MPSSSPLRLLFSRTQQFTTFRAPFLLRQQRTQIFRRYQQTVAGTPTVEGAPGAKQSILQRLWTSEVGLKTVHFWLAGTTIPIPHSYPRPNSTAYSVGEFEKNVLGLKVC